MKGDEANGGGQEAIHTMNAAAANERKMNVLANGFIDGNGLADFKGDEQTTNGGGGGYNSSTNMNDYGYTPAYNSYMSDSGDSSSDYMSSFASGQMNMANGHMNGPNSTGHSTNHSTYDEDEDDAVTDEDDDGDLAALEMWMNDEPERITTYTTTTTSNNKKSAAIAPAPKKKTEMSAKDRARKASRELLKERNDTTGGTRRSLKREHLIIKWILRITHLDKDMSIDFADWIQDGVVLTQVMTTLSFNSVERDKYGSAGCNPKEERIRSLQTQILDYGVEDKYMFRVQDMLYKKNTPKVIRCLEEVAKLSRKETHIKLDTLLRNKLYT